MNREMHDINSTKGISKESLLDRLRSVKCTILQKGFKKYLSEYIYCSCDPDMQDPICRDCYEKCHSSHEILQKKKMKAICSCGSKSHKINLSLASRESKGNFGNCPMMEWNRTSNCEFFYLHKKSNKKLCFFCLNFCEYEMQELNKQNYHLIKKLNGSDNCDCEHKNHMDNKIILKRLRDCGDPKNHNFENISKTHFLNMIVKSENSFSFLFKDFTKFLEQFKNKLENNSSNSSSFYLTDTTVNQTFILYLNVIATLTQKSNRINYFNSQIAQEFNQSFIISLMNMSSEYKSVNVWNFKLNIISIFLNASFKRDLAVVPNMRVNDVELLNPFQRLMLFNNIKAQNEIMSKYINNLKFNFLEFTLKTLNELNLTKQKFSVSYKLMRKLFNICKTYAKFNLFNYDQAIKYTNLIEDVLMKLSLMLKSSQEEGNSKNLLLEEQILLIKPIVKSLIYLSYSYNDQVAEKYFRAAAGNSSNNENLNNLKFFNENLELTKFMSKNTINCFTNILNNPITVKFPKETREIISNISSILKTFLYTRDGYSTGLKRILNKNNSIFLNYTTDNLSQSESLFVNEIRNLTNETEKAYSAFFNFESNENNLITTLKTNIKKIFDLMNLSKYRQVNVETEHMKSSFSENESDKSNNFDYIILSQSPDKFSVYPRQKTLNALTRNEIVNDHIAYDKSENNQLQLDQVEMEKFMIRNFDLIGKYKILINKSFFVFSIVKIIKVAYDKYNKKSKIFEEQNNNAAAAACENNKCINIINEDAANSKVNQEKIEANFAIESSLFSEIIKLLYFYIENNEDNSIVILSSDFLEAFVLLNNHQLNEIFGLIYIALKNIVKLKCELANHENILKFFRQILRKVKLQPYKFNEDFKIFIKIMKLIKLLTKINFMNESLVSHKIRKFIIQIYEKFSVISEFIEYLKDSKSLNVRTSEYDTDLISDNANRNFNNNNKQNLIMIDENNNINGINDIEDNYENEFQDKSLNKNNKDIINIEYYQKNLNDLSGKQNIKNTGNFDYDINDSEFNGIKVKDLSTILRYFLFLTNLLFDGDAILNEKDFLCSIFGINDIYFVLKRKSLGIELRKEILKFFRMIYVDVILEKKKMENYLFVMVDKKMPDEPEYVKINSFANSDLNNFYTYLNNLIAINESSSNSDFEFEILKYELISEEEVIEKNKGCEDLLKLEYLIEGIILPLKTHMGKFMSKLNKFTGIEYLKLYELVYYFLNLKNKIIKNENYLSVLKLRYCFKDIFQISNLKTVENFIPLKKNYSRSEIEELNKDLNTLRNPSFEFYQFEWLVQLYNKHMDSFLIPTKADSLKKEFFKKNQQYEPENISSLEAKLTSLGFLKTSYEKNAFNFIIGYYNSKRDLSNSGFMSILEDNNLQYSNSYRYLILRSIFYILREENFKEEYLRDGFWTLFKLIQYDTEHVQKEVIKLIEEPVDLVQLKDLIFFFLENLTSIIFTGCNPSISSLNVDYFLAMNIIKVLKYLCEDHNKEFQRIFFKEINLLRNNEKKHLTAKEMDINYENQKENSERIKKSDSLNSVMIANSKSKNENEENDNEENENEEDAQSRHHNFKRAHLKSKQNSLSENIEKKSNNNLNDIVNNNQNHDQQSNLNNNHIHQNHNKNNNHHHHHQVHFNNASESKETLSTFELMLDVVNKIIVFAKWNVIEYSTEDSNVSYYYDIFSVVMEFLIEMIQGTEAANLDSLLGKKKEKGENDYKIVSFLQSIKAILLRDETDSRIVYQVRKDLIDFICAFLEEKSTPIKLIKIISNIFSPFVIFSSLINTMKKLFIRLCSEGAANNSSSSKKFKNLSYKEIQFDANMRSFFEKKFFDAKNLSESPEFELANRMFQYLKILASEYANQDAIEIINFMNVSSAELKRHQKSLSAKRQQQESQSNFIELDANNDNDNNPNNNNKINFYGSGKAEEEIYYISFAEKYEVVKFFEKITRSVMVQNKSELVRVVFTINPLIHNLSTNTKNDFNQNVSRETRYIKLFSLMEYCDYFYDELVYNSKFSDLNLLMKVFKKVNYNTLEFICFVVTFIINVLMMSTLEAGEEITGDKTTTMIMEILAIINLSFCAFVSLVWFYSKFPLYWIIDSKKLALKMNVPVDSLKFWKKIKVLWNVIFFRNEIIAFLWHIVFCAIALSNRRNHFLFSVEIIIMVNLSSILKNIVKSVTLRYKQLMVTFCLFLISNYQFGVFAFYFFGEDFVTNFYKLDKDGVKCFF